MSALSLKPGVTDIMPALAELTVEVRDLQQEQIDMLDEALLTLARECDGRQGVTTAMQVTVLCPAARSMTPCWWRNVFPTAMLFIPSIGDRSHSPDEDSAKAQIKTSARVFAAAVISRALPGAWRINVTIVCWPCVA